MRLVTNTITGPKISAKTSKVVPANGKRRRNDNQDGNQDFHHSQIAPVNGSRATKKPRIKYEKPPAGAVRFKEWLAGEAIRLNIKPNALYMRMSRGKHPWPTPWRGGRKRDEFVIPSTP